MNQPLPTQQELFAAYIQLAARVTNLRTILQNEPLASYLTRESAELWAEDVRSVTHDFVFLTQNTLALVRQSLPQEPSCKPLVLPSQK